MNNTPTLQYQLSPFTDFTNHAWHDSLFLRDSTETVEKIGDYRIDALVRSGDYFVTLATALDALVVDPNDHYGQMLIDDTMADLMYLQDNYKITKKN